jgi:DoxX-like family
MAGPGSFAVRLHATFLRGAVPPRRPAEHRAQEQSQDQPVTSIKPPVSIAETVIIAMAAAANAFAAAVDFARVQWILDNMTRYGVPRRWLPVLGALKAAGALGLLAGFGVPALGLAASAGLVLYFVGAIVTVIRSGWYSHIPYPAVFLLLAVGALIAMLGSS